MSSTIASALTALQNNRLKRIQNEVNAAQTEAARQDYVLEYAGASGGVHYGRLPNGNMLAVRAVSNGAIERGALFPATKVGDQLFGHWMPE